MRCPKRQDNHSQQKLSTKTSGGFDFSVAIACSETHTRQYLMTA